MLARRGRLSAQRLNEGLPQKGKRCARRYYQ